MKYRDLIGQVVDDDTSIILDKLRRYCEPIVKAIDTRSVCVCLCPSVCLSVCCVCMCVYNITV